MTDRDVARDFLRTRRAKISPERAGLPSGDRRRVPGLRREEVAMLAGVSADYYARLEQGAIAGASDAILDAVASALQLDDAERAHLFDLARTSRPRARAVPREDRAVSASVRLILDAMDDVAAFVWNGRLDILGVNALARALWSPMFDGREPRETNLARFVFLEPAADKFYGSGLDTVRRGCVVLLRTEAGRRPHDPRLTELVGGLATQSAAFRRMWAAHDVGLHRAGGKRVHHPAVGEILLSFDVFEYVAQPATLTCYTASPGTPSADKLALLASWHAPAPR